MVEKKNSICELDNFKWNSMVFLLENDRDFTKVLEICNKMHQLLVS